METWFTSDTHFSHIPEFLWGPRGFSNEREMNEAIVDRWNNVVKPGDIVYHLGDMALTDVENAMSNLSSKVDSCASFRLITEMVSVSSKSS